MTNNAIELLAGFARRAMPNARDRKLRIVDVTQLGPSLKLAVVAFGDRELLVSVSKAGVQLIAETRTQDEPIDIRVNGKLIGRGERDMVNGRNGVSIIELTGAEEVYEAEAA